MKISALSGLVRETCGVVRDIIIIIRFRNTYYYYYYVGPPNGAHTLGLVF